MIFLNENMQLLLHIVSVLDMVVRLRSTVREYLMTDP